MEAIIKKDRAETQSRRPTIRMAQEIYGNISRAMGNEEAVVTGGIAVSLWHVKPRENDDVDVILRRIPRRREIFALKGLGFQGLSGEIFYDLFEVGEAKVGYRSAAGSSIVHLLVSNGEPILGIPPDLIFRHSVIMRSGEEPIRVIDKNLLVIMKALSWLRSKTSERSTRDPRTKDKRDIENILEEHYDGSPEAFLKREEGLIEEVFGNVAGNFRSAFLGIFTLDMKQEILPQRRA